MGKKKYDRQKRILVLYIFLFDGQMIFTDVIFKYKICISEAMQMRTLI